MREDVVGQFCDRYWDGLSATPGGASNFEECRDIITSLVDTMLSIGSDRADEDAEVVVHDDRFDAVAQRIVKLVDASPHVSTVGVLERASVDLIAELVETVARYEGRDTQAVLRDLAPESRFAEA